MLQYHSTFEGQDIYRMSQGFLTFTVRVKIVGDKAEAWVASPVEVPVPAPMKGIAHAVREKTDASSVTVHYQGTSLVFNF